MRKIDLRHHGYADYAMVIVLALAPTLLELGGAAGALCYAVACLRVLIDSVTDFPPSITKVIPFATHGSLDLGIAVFMLISPWVLDFSGSLAARDFFVLAGALDVLLFLCTDYESADLGPSRPRTAREYRA